MLYTTDTTDLRGKEAQIQWLETLGGTILVHCVSVMAVEGCEIQSRLSDGSSLTSQSKSRQASLKLSQSLSFTYAVESAHDKPCIPRGGPWVWAGQEALSVWLSPAAEEQSASLLVPCP